MGIFWGASIAAMIFFPIYLVIVGILSLVGVVFSLVERWKHRAPFVWWGVSGSIFGYILSHGFMVLFMIATVFLPVPPWLYQWQISSVPDIGDYVVKPFIMLAAGVVFGTILWIRTTKIPSG